jgi:predicted TIM-barrel fold metal-dependent hydrolase
MTRYTGEIVDAHQHFWTPGAGRHPWLRPGVRIPFRYDDYSAIKRDYLPADYARDTQGWNIVGSVYIETEWDAADPLGETSWAEDLANRDGRPSAIVAQAWLDRADAPEILAAQAAFPRVCGIRHKPGNTLAPEPNARSLMSTDAWRRGYALLSPNRLHFELQTAWWHLHEACELARDFSETLIVLNHTGLPSDRSEVGLQGWHRAMSRLAEAPNVTVKISGLGQTGQEWTVPSNGWIIRETIAMFGPARTMFASNFPVDSLCASFDTIFAAFSECAAHLPQAEQALVFADTARRIYRL